MITKWKKTNCSWETEINASLSSSSSLTTTITTATTTTFPTMFPIYGWEATTLCVNYPLWVSQLSQLCLLSPGIGKWLPILVFTCITEVETLNMEDYGYVRLHGCRPKSGLGLWPRLNTGPVCDAQRLCSQSVLPVTQNLTPTWVVTPSLPNHAWTTMLFSQKCRFSSVALPIKGNK